MPFGVVSGVGQGIVQNGGPCGSRRMGAFWGLPPLAQWFQWPNFQEKCIQLVREKLRILPYAHYIIGIYVLLAFQKCTQVRGRWWGLRVICKDVTVTSGADRLKQQCKQQGVTRCQRHCHGYAVWASLLENVA